MTPPTVRVIADVPPAADTFLRAFTCEWSFLYTRTAGEQALAVELVHLERAGAGRQIKSRTALGVGRGELVMNSKEETPQAIADFRAGCTGVAVRD